MLFYKVLIFVFHILYCCSTSIASLSVFLWGAYPKSIVSKRGRALQTLFIPNSNIKH